MNSGKSESNKKITFVDYIFAAILFLFPFIHVNTGIEVGDAAYSLLNYTTFPDMNETWAVSTFLANVTGKIFTMLPGGNTMIGVNVYCIILGGAFTVFFYFFLRKYYSSFSVFFGLLLAVGFCWCPRVILYHYMSYFLFGLGAVLLLEAIRSGKGFLYPAAGAVLALNAFVRFPNVVETLLIVVLFFYGILEKKNIVKDTVKCVAGYLGTFIGGIVVISVWFGAGSYLRMIKSLFGMTSEATSYTPKSMLTKMFGDYMTYFKPMLPFLALAVLGGIVLFFVKKRIGRILTVLVMGLLFGVIMRILYYYGTFNFNFTDYRSIYMWGVFVLMTALVLAVAGIFDKNRPMNRRLLGVAVLSIVLITPIGSNNGLYTAMNNLFLVAPFAIGELSEGIFETLFMPKFEEESGVSRVLLSFRSVGLMVCTMALISGVLFGIVFIFRDASFVSGDYAAVMRIPKLKGMRTERTQAEELENLYEYLEENSLNHKRTVCCGFVPGLMYFFEDEPALSHSWPDLDSFPKEELRQDLTLLEKDNEHPVFFYSAELVNLTDCDLDILENEKQKMFASFLQNAGYEEVLRGKRYVLALPKDGSYDAAAGQENGMNTSRE